jgi:hypothetical protein
MRNYPVKSQSYEWATVVRFQSQLPLYSRKYNTFVIYPLSRITHWLSLENRTVPLLFLVTTFFCWKSERNLSPSSIFLIVIVILRSEVTLEQKYSSCCLQHIE